MAEAVIYSRAIMLPTLADGLRVFIKLTATKLSFLPLLLTSHLAWDVLALCSYVLIALLHAGLCLNDVSSEKPSLTPTQYILSICLHILFL